jgi:hypothetical protein
MILVFISLALDGVHQVADTMGLGIDDFPSVPPLEQAISLSADCIAVQVAKRLTRITIAEKAFFTKARPVARDP